MVASGDRFRDSNVIAGFIYSAELEHAAENPVAAFHAALGVDQWVVARWRFWQAGDHGHLGQAGVAYRFAVVDLSCSLDTVGAVAQIDLVDVKLENFVLAELALDLQGQENFTDLA